MFEWIKTGKKEFMMYIVFDKLPVENYHLTISINAINQACIVIRGSFFMFVESGCISTNIEFTVP